MDLLFCCFQWHVFISLSFVALSMLNSCSISKYFSHYEQYRLKKIVEKYSLWTIILTCRAILRDSPGVIQESDALGCILACRFLILANWGFRSWSKSCSESLFAVIQVPNLPWLNTTYIAFKNCFKITVKSVADAPCFCSYFSLMVWNFNIFFRNTALGLTKCSFVRRETKKGVNEMLKFWSSLS